MARITIPLFLSFLYISNIVVAEPIPATMTKFIESSCSVTQHPAVCVRSLSLHAASIQNNPVQLAKTALTTSLAKAESTKAFMLKLTNRNLRGLKANELVAIKTCLDKMGDTVARLSQSVREIDLMATARGDDLSWHGSNLKTWGSAALSNEHTCVDGFEGQALDGKIKASIQAQVLNVAQLTSNAVTLVQRFAVVHASPYLSGAGDY
uniref:Pectinesterase inhibitor domain-containing protein n=1 Tax=Davidia involucrata TaxID=16924 RepID=A0A5B7C997_DAVIN